MLEDDAAAYLALRQRMADGIQNATPAVKRSKIEQVELKVEIKDDMATITSLFPVVMSNIRLHREGK